MTGRRAPGDVRADWLAKNRWSGRDLGEGSLSLPVERARGAPRVDAGAGHLSGLGGLEVGGDLRPGRPDQSGDHLADARLPPVPTFSGPPIELNRAARVAAATSPTRRSRGSGSRHRRSPGAIPGQPGRGDGDHPGLPGAVLARPVDVAEPQRDGAQPALPIRPEVGLFAELLRAVADRGAGVSSSEAGSRSASPYTAPPDEA